MEREPDNPCTLSSRTTIPTSITCQDNGTYEVTLTGGRSKDTLTVTVTNAPPSITSVQGPKTPVPAGKSTPVRISAKFTDPGRADTHTCKIDWKDGTTPTSGKVTNGTCEASHAYLKAGILRPTITVTDDDKAAATVQLPELIVFDPKAGASGNSVITSRAGSYPADPKLTGKGAFSFGATYRKGATVPTGTASFDFTAAGKSKTNVRLRATSSDWLLVTGSTAEYQGSGSVNGKSGYVFRITVTDGPDTFRIRIWKKSTGDVVYDNRTGAATKGIVLSR